MSVPETTVNKDCGAMFRKHQIGLSRQLARRESVTESEPMEVPSNDELGLGVSRADGRHHSRPNVRRDYINQISLQ